jgi:hypothetical protein
MPCTVLMDERSDQQTDGFDMLLVVAETVVASLEVIVDAGFAMLKLKLWPLPVAVAPTVPRTW